MMSGTLSQGSSTLGLYILQYVSHGRTLTGMVLMTIVSPHTGNAGTGTQSRLTMIGLELFMFLVTPSL